MDVYEFLFIIQLLVFIGITLAKVYNLMSLGKFYDVRKAWLLYIGVLLCYGVAIIINLLQYDTYLYNVLIVLQGAFLGLHTLFLVPEHFLMVRDHTEKKIMAYHSTKAHGINTRR